MGLVTANAVGMSGLVAAPVTVHTVTTDGSTTYVIPAGSTRVYIECIAAGGGGGGGRGHATSSPSGGKGGGGGAIVRGIYDAKSIPASLTIAVGAGGAGGNGGGTGTAGSPGVVGGDTSVTAGTFSLKAYSGGGGHGLAIYLQMSLAFLIPPWLLPVLLVCHPVQPRILMIHPRTNPQGDGRG